MTGRDRIRRRLTERYGDGKAALVLYLTCGDPSLAGMADLLVAAADAGADIIELGVPFSDPNADGPVIQAAMERALAGGGSLMATLACAHEVRRRGCDVPLVLFGYYNPIFVHGIDRFASAAQNAGIDAVLTVDVPVDELAELAEPLAERDVAVVPLCAPTTGLERAARVKPFDPAFVYYISRAGITGSEFTGAAGGPDRVAALRDTCGAPVCVGFGIKTPEDAREVASYADGVVIGSAAIAAMEGDGGTAGAIERLSAYVKSIADAIH